MDNDRQPEGDEPLEDAQRIELLEKAHKLDRLLLMALAGALLVILASWVTYVIVLAAEDDETASADAVSQLQQEVGTLNQQVTDLKQQLAASQSSAAAHTPEAAITAGTDDPTVTRQVAKTLIGQERNFQQSLAALKLGMRDLAGMIPGSRSWLTIYYEALDAPLGDSRARMKELEGWAANLPTAEAPTPAVAPASPNAASD